MGATSRSDALIKIVNTINAGCVSRGPPSRGKKIVPRRCVAPGAKSRKEFTLTANAFNFKSTLDRFQSNACVSATSGADDRFAVSLFLLLLLITILSLFFERKYSRGSGGSPREYPTIFSAKTRTFNESIRAYLKNLVSNVSFRALPSHTKQENIVTKNARKSSVFDISGKKKKKKNFSQARRSRCKKGEERSTKLEEWAVAEEGGICADQITQIKNKQRG